MEKISPEEIGFHLRAYTKVELATMYSPTQCVTVALQTLSRWMRTNAMLMEELQTIGYNKYRRGFTPKEVRIIVKYLGEP